MPIKFQCPSCAASIKAPDTHAGQTLPCPKCGQPVVVPAATPAPAPSPAAPVAPATGAAAAPAPPTFPQPSEPEPIAEMPEIVTRDARQHQAPPPVAPSTPAVDAYAPPQTVSTRTIDVDLQNVRVVDLKLPFGSVFKFALQFFLCNLLLSGIVFVLFMVIGMLLALVGLSLG